jgi:hypothetical protein
MKTGEKCSKAFAGGLILVTLAWFCNSLPAVADSESGGFVFDSGSESGGAEDTGAESEAGNVRHGDSATESGGALASGSESDSGGLVETGAETESGGPNYQGNTDENRLIVRTYHW